MEGRSESARSRGSVRNRSECGHSPLPMRGVVFRPRLNECSHEDDPPGSELALGPLNLLQPVEPGSQLITSLTPEPAAR